MNARKHAKTPKKKVSPFAPLELTETSSTPHGSISPPVFPGSKNLTAIDSHILKAELEFTTDIPSEECLELTYIMYHIFEYPSLSEAETHRLASRLGTFDIDKENSSNLGKEYCRCCGYTKQENEIPICAEFMSFPSVGLSTFLFFETIRSLIALLLIVFVCFGLFALFSNLYMSGIFEGEVSVTSIDLIIDYLSLKSKIGSESENGYKLYVAEMWVGVIVVIIWSGLLYLIGYYEKKYVFEVDIGTISAADFSICIENYPEGLTIVELQKQIDEYGEKLRDGEEGEQLRDDAFKIEKLNMGLNMDINKDDEEEMKGINEKYYEMLEMFADWLCDYEFKEGLPFTFEKRIKIYNKFHKLTNQRLRKGRRLLETMYSQNSVEQREFREKRTTAYITFKYSETKDLICKNNTEESLKWIHDLFQCFPSRTLLELKNEKGLKYENLMIYQAPEPEDIKWENLRVSNLSRNVRRGGIYLVSFILLMGSFYLVYLMSKSQLENEENFYLSFFISFAISLINFVIGLLIRSLTILECDYTQTEYQTSLAIKSIVAQLINSIMIPIIVNEIIENSNIYGRNGLSTDIIYLAITNSFLAPLSKIVDPYYRFLCLRAFYYRESLRERLLMKQMQLNESQELMEFETGYEYIYFINLYLFTAFFMTLQPIIVLPAIIGMLMMYWAQKYSLFNRMKRPVPGNEFMNVTMRQMINAGPIFFGLGGLCWSHFFGEYQVVETNLSFFVPNIVGGSLAFLFFVFPFNLVFDKYYPKSSLENLEYQECKIHMNSEYDRVNPVTMEAAIKEYEVFLENFDPQQMLNDLDEDSVYSHTEAVEFDKKITTLQKNIDGGLLGFGVRKVDNEEGESGYGNDGQKKEKKKSNLLNQQESGSSKNLIDILKRNLKDKHFLSRKREILKNRGRMRSNLGEKNVNSTIAELIGKEINEEDIFEEVNTDENQNVHPNKMELSEIKETMMESELYQSTKPKPKEPEPEESSAELIKEELSLNKIIIKPTCRDEESKYARNSVLQPSSFILNLKDTLRKENQRDKEVNDTHKEKKYHEIKIETPEFNSKIDNDFSKLFPSRKNSESIFQSSSSNQTSPTVDYKEYFGKSSFGEENKENVKSKVSKEKRGRSEKYRYNPFDKAFG